MDDLDQACQKMEAAQATSLTRKRGLDAAMAPGAHRNFEMKWSGPDEVVIDISHTAGTPSSTRSAPRVRSDAGRLAG